MGSHPKASLHTRLVNVPKGLSDGTEPVTLAGALCCHSWGPGLRQSLEASVRLAAGSSRLEAGGPRRPDEAP